MSYFFAHTRFGGNITIFFGLVLHSRCWRLPIARKLWRSTTFVISSSLSVLMISLWKNLPRNTDTSRELLSTLCGTPLRSIKVKHYSLQLLSASKFPLPFIFVSLIFDLRTKIFNFLPLTNGQTYHYKNSQIRPFLLSPPPLKFKGLKFAFSDYRTLKVFPAFWLDESLPIFCISDDAPLTQD